MNICRLAIAGLIFTVNGNLLFAEDSPGPPITMAAFGNRCYNHDRTAGTSGDTWDTTWLADGRVLTQYDDGTGFTASHTTFRHDGLSELQGTPEDISTIKGINLNPGTLGQFLGKTYSAGLYEVDNALYHIIIYSIQKPGAWQFLDANLYKSVDGGATWLNHLGEKDKFITRDTPSATFPDQRWGEVDFVKYGRGGEAPDLDRAREFAYLSCGGMVTNGGMGDTYLARIRRADLTAWSTTFDRSKIEYYCGADNADGTLDSNWTPDIGKCTPVRKEGALGGMNVKMNLGMVWNPGLKRYLMTADNSDSWQKTPVTSTLFIYEAPHPWGPWTEIDSEYIEPRVGDNLTWFYLMQAFMSPDGTRMWATVTGKKPYGIQFLPIYLTTQPVETRTADQAELSGPALGHTVAGALSSSGYVDGFHQSGDSCTFTIPVTTAGLYALRYRYHCDQPKQTLSLTVNGQLHGHLALGNTVQSQLPWNQGTERIWLDAGSATIQFHLGSEDTPNPNLLLDRIQLGLLSTVPEPHSAAKP